MLKDLIALDNVVYLVPMTALQFVDFGFAQTELDATSFAFAAVDAVHSAKGFEAFHYDRAEQCYRGAISGTMADRRELPVFLNPSDVLAVFDRTWLPVPLFASRGRDEAGREKFELGPTTWGRLRVCRLSDPDTHGNTHRVVLGIDTHIQDRVPGRDYVSPSREDSKRGQVFNLLPRGEMVDAFTRMPWVAKWLRLEHARHASADPQPKIRHAGDSPPPEWLPLAVYDAFLELVVGAIRPPTFKLVDVASAEPNYEPIPVDLVLDLGNSRTCGLIVEDVDSARANLDDSYPLEIRDLSDPEYCYSDPFGSRIEFKQARFGPKAIEPESGRGSAFQWPSVVRVGHEAGRLFGSDLRARGTGLSSPKRYLWDHEPENQVWRFHGEGDDGAPEPPVDGPIMSFLNDHGDVLRQLETAKRSHRLIDARKMHGLTPALNAKFSRSSLYVQLLAEILLHAIVQVNSIGNRLQRSHPAIPRRLRRIILTMPPATPLPERRIIDEHAEAAVMLVWGALGWTERPDWAIRDITPPPVTWTRWDEATCTQLVFLYTEIVEKFNDAPIAYCRAMQLRKSERAGLRIASVDLGGGTTDLMIISYEPLDDRTLMPRQEFREGFRFAGDDILNRVIARHVLPAIISALKDANHPRPDAPVKKWVAGRRGQESEQVRLLHRHFVSHIAVPIALKILADYEQSSVLDGLGASHVRIGDVVADQEAIVAPIAAAFEAEIRDSGIDGFSLNDVAVSAAHSDVEQTIQAAIGRIIENLGEVIYRYQCDYVLLSGRPSRLPAIRNILEGKRCIPPDRIVSLAGYRTGRWYPFRTVDGAIADPKTTVAVGAMMLTLIESAMPGLAVIASELTMKSTARYIGIMENSETIRGDQNILFSDIDLDAPPPDGESAHCRFYHDVVLGFRQLPCNRWRATPLYSLEFADRQQAWTVERPLTVTLRRGVKQDEDDDDSVREDFYVEEVVDARNMTLAHDVIRLRLQTLSPFLGREYWLDTGAIDLD